MPRDTMDSADTGENVGIFRLVKVQKPVRILEAGSYVARVGDDFMIVDLGEDTRPRDVAEQVRAAGSSPSTRGTIGRPLRLEVAHG